MFRVRPLHMLRVRDRAQQLEDGGVMKRIVLGISIVCLVVCGVVAAPAGAAPGVYVAPFSPGAFEGNSDIWAGPPDYSVEKDDMCYGSLTGCRAASSLTRQGRFTSDLGYDTGFSEGYAYSVRVLEQGTTLTNAEIARRHPTVRVDLSLVAAALRHAGLSFEQVDVDATFTIGTEKNGYLVNEGLGDDAVARGDTVRRKLLSASTSLTTAPNSTSAFGPTSTVVTWRPGPLQPGFISSNQPLSVVVLLRASMKRDEIGRTCVHALDGSFCPGGLNPNADDFETDVAVTRISTS
jgi:hypothetical protein